MAKFKKKIKKPDLDVSAMKKVQDVTPSKIGKITEKKKDKLKDKKKNKLKEEKKKVKKLKGGVVAKVAEKEAKADEEDLLTLDILKELGGDEEDLKLVENLDGKDTGEDLSAETENELKSLLKSLNFKKFKPNAFVVKDAEVEAEEKEEEKKVVAVKKAAKEVQDDQVSSTSDLKKEEIKDEEVEEGNLLPESATKRSGEFHFLKETPTRGNPVVKGVEGGRWWDLVNTTSVASQVWLFVCFHVDTSPRRR